MCTKHNDGYMFKKMFWDQMKIGHSVQLLSSLAVSYLRLCNCILNFT